MNGTSIRFVCMLVAALTAAGCGRKAEERPPLTGPKAWALASAALLTERNRERHDLLGGRERTEETMKRWRAGMVDGWGIGSREDLLRTLGSLEEGGDRKEFEELGAHVTSLSRWKYRGFLKKSKKDPEMYSRITLVKENYDTLGKKGLLGWDYCRHISLCRWGYLAGYFTEEEAWERVMPAARKLQEAFDSWQTLGTNYLIGREFWSREDMEKNGHLYREAYQRLIENPASPWNVYPWNMNLGDRRGEGAAAGTGEAAAGGNM